MKNRSELREIIMKVIYQINILKEGKLNYDVDTLIKEQLEVENEFVNQIVKGVEKNQSSISKKANEYLTNWTIDRFNKVDQAILSIGIYELMYTDTPAIVVINEALELSKKYSELEVTKMINAVLDNIYHSEEQNG